MSTMSDSAFNVVMRVGAMLDQMDDDIKNGESFVPADAVGHAMLLSNPFDSESLLYLAACCMMAVDVMQRRDDRPIQVGDQVAVNNEDSMLFDFTGAQLSPNETCPTCGQPDNCGDCDHTPIEDFDV